MDYELLSDRYRPQMLALQEVAAAFGTRRASEVFGRSYSMMQNAANPHQSKHQFTALQLVHLVAETGSPALLKSLADLIGYVVVPSKQLLADLPLDKPELLAAVLLHAHVKSSSDVGAVMSSSLDDFEINPLTELPDLERAITGQIAMMNSVLAVLRKMAK